MGSHRPAKHVRVQQPKKFEERLDVALQCARAIELKVPLLIDGVDNAAAHAFGGTLGRVYVLDRNARVVYRSGPLVLDFNTEELEKRLAGILR